VRASAATLNWTVVTGASVDACHRLGIAVYVWTVNDPDLVHSLVETGIDAIITDDPGVVLVA
jgi:glycerophosphoryl diester phosphodiesterase